MFACSYVLLSKYPMFELHSSLLLSILRQQHVFRLKKVCQLNFAGFRFLVVFQGIESDFTDWAQGRQMQVYQSKSCMEMLLSYSKMLLPPSGVSTMVTIFKPIFVLTACDTSSSVTKRPILVISVLRDVLLLLPHG